MKRRRSLSMLLTSIAVACGAPISPPSSSVQIRVVDEAKEPVAGAEIAAGGGTVIARTDSSGLAEITLSGAEGATFHVEIRCPTLYRSPSAPVAIRRFDGRGSSPEYVARCSKTRHTLVVAVRTQGATNMPVYHLGKEVARTDESGSAHVLIEGEVMTGFRLAGEVLAGEWMKEFVTSGAAVMQVWPSLLAPLAQPATGAVSRGRIVCSCHDVAESAISACLRAGESLGEVQAKLKCGTGCGSCVPELRRMARDMPVAESVTDLMAAA